jgi:hypothetical protein
MSVTFKGMTRNTPQLYRDCLRLVKHIAGKSKKAQNLTKIVRGEFKKNAKVNDDALIENLKSNAIRALANYLMIESTNKDAKFKNKTISFNEREAKSINDDNDVVNDKVDT